jgi:hypothetical protein
MSVADLFPLIIYLGDDDVSDHLKDLYPGMPAPSPRTDTENSRES